MPSFSMDDLMNSQEGRAFNARELTPKKAEEVIRVVGRRGKRSLADSEMLIKNYILGSEEPVTMLQILDHIGRAPAPHFRAIVNRLVETGEIVKAVDMSVGGNLPRFWYWHP
jgi:hypothetical protein